MNAILFLIGLLGAGAGLGSGRSSEARAEAGRDKSTGIQVEDREPVPGGRNENEEDEETEEERTPPVVSQPETGEDEEPTRTPTTGEDGGEEGGDEEGGEEETPRTDGGGEDEEPAPTPTTAGGGSAEETPTGGRSDDEEAPTGGTDTDTDTGTNTGTDTGTNTGTSTGTTSGTASGTTSGTTSGTNTGSNTGTNTDTGATTTTSAPTSNTGSTAGTVSNPTPSTTSQSGAQDDGGAMQPLSAGNGSTVSVMSGRVATIDPTDTDIASIRIVSGLNHGNVTVNPDNSFAVVMTQSTFTGNQSFTYEVTHSDGSTSTGQIGLNVTPRPSGNDHGWGDGSNHYMLATDAAGNLVVEHGDNHQKVYVSESPNALSRADIAAIEGLSTGQITNDWLANSAYGRTEALALDTDAGLGLFKTITPSGSQTSNWLLFERGYSYSDNTVIQWGSSGESELHPLYMGAWGTGARPVLTEALQGFGGSFDNFVIQGVEFHNGATILDGSNVIFDDVVFTDEQLNLQGGFGMTIRNSSFYDIVTDITEAGSISNGTWQSGDFTQGTFVHNIDGLLIENSFWDHNGWEDSYRVDGSTAGGQPPQMFNHNIYIQDSNSDVTLRDSIIMRGSLNGMQIRSGGFIEDNVMIANNVAGNFQDDSFTLFADNLITHAGNKQAPNIGFETAGFDAMLSNMASMVDTIVAHMIDPANPTTVYRADWAYRVTNPYYDDTIVYNWDDANSSSRFVTEQNTGGLDPSILDATTIQNFTAQLLGQSTATIDDLATYLKAQADGAFANVVDADLIINFFQTAFGIAPDIRTGASTLRFVPDDLGEGVRWDNRLNWDTDDLPGLYATDSADLGGNDVMFGTNATIDRLDLSDGDLTVYGGKLTLNGGIEDTGSISVQGAGQLWANGSDGASVDIDVTGGRFANTGNMSGVNLTVSGGQALLATGGAEFDLLSGDVLDIREAGTKVGFDGTGGGMAILDLHQGSTLSYAADDGGLGSIAEFRSGAFGNAPDVQSGIDLGSSDLSIDLSGLSASAGTAFTLMSADEIVGIFNNATVGGLGGRNATITVDYTKDTVTLQLSANGNGSVSVQTVGQESDVSTGEQALWDALTSGQGTLSNSLSSSVASAGAMVAPDDDPTAMAA